MTAGRRPGGAPGRAITPVAYTTFTLVGWTTILVPTLIRQIKADFGQTDAGIGLLYLATAAAFAAGALLSGLLAGRIGRGRVLVAGALVVSAGLVVEALAPAWLVFAAGASLAGLGSGTLDAGVNGVIMDFAATDGRSGALNRLHVFFSVGALAAPLVLGLVVSAGVDWRVPVGLTAIAAAALTRGVVVLGTVAARPAVPAGVEAGAAAAGDGADAAGEAADAAGPRGTTLRVVLLLLAAAIACYVATEAGVSSWLVAFLATETVAVATLALSLYWAALAGGRLVAGRIADRFAPSSFATGCAVLAGASLAGALAVPSGAVQIALFALTGFFLGPVYPTIMSVAGALVPHRAAVVSGLLTFAAVFGSVIYPPLMGLASEQVGLAAGMAGAAGLALLAGAAVLVAARVAGRRPPPAPMAVP